MSLNEGRVGGGGGDKLSAVYGDGLLANGDQVAVGPDIHAVVRDGGGGIAAFIKIVDGENFEFPVPTHHDGFTVGIDAVNIAARGYGAAKETAAPYSAFAPVNLAGSGFHAGHDALIVPEEKFLAEQ